MVKKEGIKKSVTETGAGSMRVEEKPKTGLAKLFNGLVMWFDSDCHDGTDMTSEKVNWLRCIPFFILHMSCFSVIWLGTSPVAVITAVVIYFSQMFTITGLYHRYFSHQTFKTSRFFQFFFALWGGVAVQKGALWWASHHRHHHRYSDQDEDVHSPTKRGFWWSHIGWITADKYFLTKYKYIPDLAKFPELVLINRFDIFVPLAFGTFMFFFGYGLNIFFPELGTGASQMLVWGYLIPTVFSLHATFTINSLTHVWGKQRFKTTDTSRNNFFLSIITLGEGWHNNHHRYQASVRQGFYWWELDITYYILKVLSWMGIIWNLRPVPDSVYREADMRKQELITGKTRLQNGQIVDSILDEPIAESTAVKIKKETKMVTKKSAEKGAKTAKL